MTLFLASVRKQLLMRCESLLVIVGHHGSSENNTLRKKRPEEGKGRKISHPADVLMQYEHHPQLKPTAAKSLIQFVAGLLLLLLFLQRTK